MANGGTEPRIKRESAMESQCNRCVGSGKCPTCSGRGEVEASEPRSFRRTRLHRFDPPDPPPSGVWRYQARSAARTRIEAMTDGAKMAKPDPAPANPVCAGDEIWPCLPDCWRPCAQCGKLVCEKHDYLVPVWPPENGGCDPANMICRECIAALWATGDISQGARVEYLY